MYAFSYTVPAPNDRRHQPVFAEAHQFAGHHGGTHGAINGAGPEAARRGAGDELVAKAIQEFVAGSQCGDVVLAVLSFQFGIGQGRRNQHRTGMREHPV